MITILCAGSRGDFQPYIALAQELMALGKAVRIAGNRSFAQFIQGYGIDFFPINADMNSLQVDPRMLQAAASADNPFKMLLAFNKMKEYGIYMVHDFFAACEGSNPVVEKHPPAVSAARERGRDGARPATCGALSRKVQLHAALVELVEDLVFSVFGLRQGLG